MLIFSSVWFIADRGTQPQCSLARAQLSMVIAALFRKAGPNLKLYDTDESAVDPVYAYAMPLARNHEKGVKVVVL